MIVSRSHPGPVRANLETALGDRPQPTNPGITNITIRHHPSSTSYLTTPYVHSIPHHTSIPRQGDQHHQCGRGRVQGHGGGQGDPGRLCPRDAHQEVGHLRPPGHPRLPAGATIPHCPTPQVTEPYHSTPAHPGKASQTISQDGRLTDLTGGEIDYSRGDQPKVTTVHLNLTIIAPHLCTHPNTQKPCFLDWDGCSGHLEAPQRFCGQIEGRSFRRRTQEIAGQTAGPVRGFRTSSLSCDSAIM